MTARIQQIFIAMFGRPADPFGMAFWNTQTFNGANLTPIVNTLSATAEYQSRFAGLNNAQLVNSIYTSLYGRPADTAGLTFFEGQLSSGQMNLTTIAINILDGARNTDKQIIDNKTTAALSFTIAIDTSQEIVGYNASSVPTARAYLAGVNANASSIPNAAAVDAAVLAATGTIRNDNRIIDVANLGSAGFRIDGAAAGDVSGYSVASAGDVNRDGFADLIIGAPGADPSGRSDAGSSYVVFGKASGFSNLNLGNLGSAGFRIDGAAAGDVSGHSVASAGDVNRDGFADLIIGAPGADPSGRSDAGSSYVVSGSSNLDLANLGSAGFQLNGAAAGDVSGYSVASAGDVNRDGFADLIIGAPEADPSGRSDAGSSYVVFGFSNLDFRIIDGAAAGDVSGYSVASAGDVNRDGFADLIIGAPGADPSGRSDAGSSYVVFGKASGFTDIDLGNLGSAGFRIDGAAAGDLSAYSVASAGDVNRDGFADLIIGAPSASPSGRSFAGSSYVVFGKASGFSNLDLGNLGSAGFRIDGAAVRDLSGFSVASAGDVNRDGFADLIIGAPEADPSGRSNAGSTYVVFGKASGFSNLNLGNLGSAGFRIDGAAVDDFSGRSVASAGDVNRDGYADLIVGAYYADPSGRNAAGSSYVIFGGDYW
jgi:hypothetical protein